MPTTLKANYVTSVTVVDPDSKGDVAVAIFKDESSGALFGVDESFVAELDENETVTEPFNNNRVLLAGV